MPKEEAHSRVLPRGLGTASREAEVKLCVTVLAGAVGVLLVCCSCSLNGRPGLPPAFERSADCLCVNGDFIAAASLLPPVPPVARSSQCRCRDHQGPLYFLAYFSSFPYSTTDRDFLFPSSLCTCLFDLHSQDDFRVSIHTPSLFLLITLMSRFHLFFFSSAPFHEVCFAQGYISLCTLGRFLENPLLFIIVLVWKLSIKRVTQWNCSCLQRHSE